MHILIFKKVSTTILCENFKNLVRVEFEENSVFAKKKWAEWARNGAYISPQTPYSAKLWFSSYGPKCSWSIKLQDSLKCLKKRNEGSSCNLETLKFWVGVQWGQSYLMGRRCLFSLG